jgi:hypothetical protein
MEEEIKTKKGNKVIIGLVLLIILGISLAVANDLNLIDLSKLGLNNKLNETYWQGFSNGSNSAFAYVNDYLIYTLNFNYNQTQEFKAYMPIYINNEQINLTCRPE